MGPYRYIPMGFNSGAVGFALLLAFFVGSAWVAFYVVFYSLSKMGPSLPGRLSGSWGPKSRNKIWLAGMAGHGRPAPPIRGPHF